MQIRRAQLLFPVALLMLLNALGCSHLGEHSTSVSAPETSSASTHVEPLIIFATSDIEDTPLASLYSSQGGIAEISGLFDSAKNEFGNRIIWLDGGHLFAPSGSIAAQNTDLIFQQSEISATLKSDSTKQILQHENPEDIYSVGKTKVGIVHARNRKSLSSDLRDERKDIQEQSESLRKKGAELVVLLSDLPIFCRNHLALNSSNFHKPNESQGYCEGALARILEELPPGNVDLAIVSGTQQELHHFVFPSYSSSPVAGIPVVSSAPKGGSCHILHFYLDLQRTNTQGSQSPKIVWEKTRIEGPVAISSKMNWRGRRPSPNPKMTQLTSTLSKERAIKNKEILGKFNSELEIAPTRESTLTDWLSDVIRSQTQSDIALVPLMVLENSERPEIGSGSFSQADLLALFPTEVPILNLELKGEEVRMLARIAENGSHGFSSVSGLRLKVLHAEEEAPGTDLNDDHKIQLWEINRLKGIQLANSDSEIQLKATYRVAVPLALVQAAEYSDSEIGNWSEYRWISQNLKLTHRYSSPPVDLRTLIIRWLHQNPVAVEPVSRIQFEKAKMPKAKKRGHRRRKSRTR